MFCPECGYKNKDENKFCLKCGKEFVPQKQTKSQQNTNYDPKAEEEKNKNEALESAVQAMSLGTLKDYENAAEILRKLQGWKNADELKKQCEEKIEVLREEALIQRKKRIKSALFISVPIAVLLVAAVIVGILITPKLKYDKATEFLDNADYANASVIFEEIRDYKNSETALTYISVMNGDITDYDEKVNILESLGDYRNSAEVLLDLKYEKACEYADSGNYREAVELLDSLDGHDPDNVKNGIYTTAVGYFDDRKFAQAAEIFLILGKYEDSEEYVEKVYNQAETYQKDKKFHYAAAVYMALGSYKDSKDKVEELYKKCLDFIEKEKYTDAIPVLKNLKDYKESESKLEEIYNKAVQLVEDKKYDKAEKIFEKFGKYKDSEEKLNEISELKKKEKYDKAVKLGEDEKYDEAIKLFEELGDYGDSKDKISEMKKKRDADTYEMKGTVAWVKIDNGYLNIRASAKSDAKSVGKLYNGDEVTIQATSSDKKWYKVTSGSITGYCSVDYITTSAVDQFLGFWSTGKSGWEISKIDSMTVAITGSIIDGAASIYKYEMTGTYNDGAIYFYGTETDTDYWLGMSSPSIITTDISGTLTIYGDTLHCNFSNGGGYTLTRSN
ncbi:MAG: SH3 domain-containing protein [Clostridium sp.]|nr:SH3 domain-containing protein [Clostridium sp.]